MLFTITFALLLLGCVQAQSYNCSCSCCFGQGCRPSLLSTYAPAAACTNDACLAACKTRFYQCNTAPPSGQAVGSCITATTTTTTTATNNPLIIGGPYSCKCDCCSTGSSACTPALVGYTNAFSCQIGACSIACSRQYPSVCVNTQFGQTQGTCVGSTGSTPNIPTGSMRCGCSCCGTAGCQNYEVTTTSGCTSCLSRCQSIQLSCNSYQNTYCVN